MVNGIANLNLLMQFLNCMVTKYSLSYIELPFLCLLHIRYLSV
uniref:Uncharacterized protein n=1 Tax=Arundo donax TaxID=35708 RepID=A0A0A9G070_ARUDO